MMMGCLGCWLGCDDEALVYTRVCKRPEATAPTHWHIVVSAVHYDYDTPQRPPKQHSASLGNNTSSERSNRRVTRVLVSLLSSWGSAARRLAAWVF